MKKHDGLFPCSECDGEGETPSSLYVNWFSPTKKYQEHFDKHHPHKVCDACSGEGERFYEDDEEYFNKLADRFEKETIVLSFVDTTHPCYKAMRKMGRKAIPYLLRRMRRQRTWLMHLFSHWLKKEEGPEIPEEIRGKIDELTKMWIEWGVEKKLIKSEK